MMGNRIRKELPKCENDGRQTGRSIYYFLGIGRLVTANVVVSCAKEEICYLDGYVLLLFRRLRSCCIVPSL